MKTNYFILIALLLGIFFQGNIAFAQMDTAKVPAAIYHIVTTYDGGEFTGEIILDDEKEVLILTKDRGRISIPKYQVKEIKKIKSSEMSASGEYMPADLFASRYFITTNGLYLAKGESYVLWNLYGPDFQFGVGENFGVGIMTSWVGSPLIGTAKYSMQFDEKVSFSVGLLLGTGSWASPEFGLALPYAALTFGDGRNNINFSAGYGGIFYGGDSEGSALFSVAGMSKVGKKVSLVFDSFIVPAIGNNSFGGALLLPGLRLQQSSEKAFQFGFAGLVAEGELIPVPLPFIQFFRKF